MTVKASLNVGLELKALGGKRVHLEDYYLFIISLRSDNPNHENFKKLNRVKIKAMNKVGYTAVIGHDGEMRAVKVDIMMEESHLIPIKRN